VSLTRASHYAIVQQGFIYPVAHAKPFAADRPWRTVNQEKFTTGARFFELDVH